MTNHANLRPQPTPDQLFGARLSRMAKQQCAKLIRGKAGEQAAQRITMAVLGAMQAARDPSAFHHCTDLSLANCIALSAQTGLLPGGPSPSVYLVPQSARRGEPPELQWRITHRGISVLAYRSGFALRAVPVAAADFLSVSLGEVVEHAPDGTSWPSTLEELQGIAVCVKDLDRGRDVIRAWVAMPVIAARRALARSSNIWQKWPIEMAQKTAIKYCLARGVLPLDSAELSVALTEDRPDVIEADARTIIPEIGAVSSSTPHAAPALPDNGPPVDELAGAAPRERVPVDASNRTQESGRVHTDASPRPNGRVQTDARVHTDASTRTQTSTTPPPSEGTDRRQVLKDACEALEKQLNSGEIDEVREKRGPRLGKEVQRWSGGTKGLTLYRDALQIVLDAKAAAAVDHTPPAESSEPAGLES